MHSNSGLLFEKYGRQFIRSGCRLLEIGPDKFPSSYARLANDQTVTWDTLDMHSGSDLTYPNAGEYSFPIPDESYDVVLAGQVLEHVKKIWVWVRELERVCKKGGHVILINPVSAPFHEAPVDCWRVYPDGMRALLEDTGLRIIETRFESLEAPGFRKYVPGVSAQFHSKKRWLFYRLAAPIGISVERSYDTITVAQRQ
jgi:ubiquinone/menaquinone biosynthesis C-methylase UbiE